MHRRGRTAVLRRSALVAALAVSGLLVFSAVGCNAVITLSGETETESRDIEDFDRVALSGIGTLRIEPGKTASLTIRADRNLMPYITAEVEDSELELRIDTKGRGLRMGEGAVPEFILTAPSITAITNSGSGRISGGPFSGGLLTIVDSGSGTVELGDVDVLNLDTTISGSGAVGIDGGLTGAQVVTVSGSGSFEAPDLESKVATVRVSGSGDVELWATEGLDAAVSGSGSVSYWGTPEVTEEISGSGDVESLGAKSSGSD